MLIKEEDWIKKANGESCIVIECPIDKSELGLAVAEINGRYPDFGKVVNTKCDEIYYVISGEATIHHETGNYEVKRGDAFYFEKNKWYYVDARKLKIVLPTAPAWFPEQYRLIK